MENQNYKSANRKVLCCYKDNKDLDFVGIFLNPHHMEAAMNISNANIGKYLACKINELQGYIVVSINIQNESIDTKNIAIKAMESARARQIKSKLLHLSNETILGLDDEQIKKISDIINNKN